MSDDRIRKLESIGFRWININALSDLWHRRFQGLKKCKETHGNCDVPRKHEHLGLWVMNQRQKYRLSKEGKSSGLADDRIRKLESIGFRWIGINALSTEKLSDLWHRSFQGLKKYKETHGNCNVPRRHDHLGIWVMSQRRNHRLLKEGKSSPMSDDRISKLESIGFQWSFKCNELWDEHFQELEKYMETHGNCDVSSRHGSFGIWVFTQRQKYRLLKEGKSSPMSDDRIRKLESIGFQWISERALTNEERYDLWHIRYQELKKYEETHGNCNVSLKFGSGSLVIWVKNQRQTYQLLKEGKSSPMSDDCIHKLESIGFCWSCKRQHDNVETYMPTAIDDPPNSKSGTYMFECYYLENALNLIARISLFETFINTILILALDACMSR